LEDGTDWEGDDMIMINPDTKQFYWNYFIAFRGYWPRGFTKRRLERIRLACWENGHFWGDVIYRHGGHSDPRDIKPEVFDHAIGNFYAMLADISREAGIIR